MLKSVQTDIVGVLEIIPEVFNDERGSFLETFNIKNFSSLGIEASFVQDNQSISKKGVLRGLHFQTGPKAQGKLVRVAKGAVLDVVVDVREGSESFGKWQSFLLDGENKKMLWVPEGLAHGFLSLEDETIFQYKCTNYYDKSSESGIIWNDETLKIDWQLKEFGIKDPILSPKDSVLPNFKILQKNEN